MVQTFVPAQVVIGLEMKQQIFVTKACCNAGYVPAVCTHLLSLVAVVCRIPKTTERVVCVLLYSYRKIRSSTARGKLVRPDFADQVHEHRRLLPSPVIYSFAEGIRRID
jgi:hypothetical protein